MMTSKPSSNLKTCPAEAKYFQESHFDAKTRLVPPESTETYENLKAFFQRKVGIKKIENRKCSRTYVAKILC